MKPHYRKLKGYRRNPGRGGRPMYYMRMSASEVWELRLLYLVIGTMTLLIGGAALWLLSMT